MNDNSHYNKTSYSRRSTLEPDQNPTAQPLTDPSPNHESNQNLTNTKRISANLSNNSNSNKPVELKVKLARLDQRITSTLQDIDSVFNSCHELAANELLPLVEKYGDLSRTSLDAVRCWEAFFRHLGGSGHYTQPAEPQNEDIENYQYTTRYNREGSSQMSDNRPPYPTRIYPISQSDFLSPGTARESRRTSLRYRGVDPDGLVSPTSRYGNETDFGFDLDDIAPLARNEIQLDIRPQTGLDIGFDPDAITPCTRVVSQSENRDSIPQTGMDYGFDPDAITPQARAGNRSESREPMPQTGMDFGFDPDAVTPQARTHGRSGSPIRTGMDYGFDPDAITPDANFKARESRLEDKNSDSTLIKPTLQFPTSMIEFLAAPRPNMPSSNHHSHSIIDLTVQSNGPNSGQPKGRINIGSSERSSNMEPIQLQYPTTQEGLIDPNLKLNLPPSNQVQDKGKQSRTPTVGTSRIERIKGISQAKASANDERAVVLSALNPMLLDANSFNYPTSKMNFSDTPAIQDPTPTNKEDAGLENTSSSVKIPSLNYPNPMGVLYQNDNPNQPIKQDDISNRSELRMSRRFIPVLPNDGTQSPYRRPTRPSLLSKRDINHQPEIHQLANQILDLSNNDVRVDNQVVDLPNNDVRIDASPFQSKDRNESIESNQLERTELNTVERYSEIRSPYRRPDRPSILSKEDVNQPEIHQLANQILDLSNNDVRVGNQAISLSNNNIGVDASPLQSKERNESIDSNHVERTESDAIETRRLRRLSRNQSDVLTKYTLTHKTETTPKATPKPVVAPSGFGWANPKTDNLQPITHQLSQTNRPIIGDLFSPSPKINKLADQSKRGLALSKLGEELIQDFKFNPIPSLLSELERSMSHHPDGLYLEQLQTTVPILSGPQLYHVLIRLQVLEIVKLYLGKWMLL